MQQETLPSVISPPHFDFHFTYILEYCHNWVLECIFFFSGTWPWGLVFRISLRGLLSVCHCEPLEWTLGEAFGELEVYITACLPNNIIFFMAQVWPAKWSGGAYCRAVGHCSGCGKCIPYGVGLWSLLCIITFPCNMAAIQIKGTCPQFIQCRRVLTPNCQVVKTQQLG